MKLVIFPFSQFHPLTTFDFMHMQVKLASEARSQLRFVRELSAVWSPAACTHTRRRVSCSTSDKTENECLESVDVVNVAIKQLKHK